MLTRFGEVVGIATSGNMLLNHLQPADCVMLLPHLQRVALPRGMKLLRAGERIDTLYFPETGMLSLEESIGRSHIEIAVVGREGMLGWPALLGCERNVHDTVVQGQDGNALCIALQPVLTACRASASLWMMLLGFVQAVMTQMARTIAAHGECSLNQRVARWVLMRHDRVGGDQILIRHDEIAGALNVRRASVTDRLHILEGERLISCRRGRILIRDRHALERFAGDAYGSTEYRGLAAPFGKSLRPASEDATS